MGVEFDADIHFSNILKFDPRRDITIKIGGPIRNFSTKWSKKLKFGIYTNMLMGNTMRASIFQNFENLTPGVISQ